MTPPRSRSVPLDVLRALAVLLVLGRHIPLPLVMPVGWAYSALSTFHLGGWMGVDLFFVLSGYLVSGLLFDEYLAKGRTDPARFLARRGLRIYPAYYFLLIFSVIASIQWVRPHHIIAEGFFIQNYFLKWSMWNHTWSLAIEEHFYFMLALLLWGLSRKGGRDPFKVLIPLAAVLAVFCLSMRFVHPKRTVDLMIMTHLRIDSLFFGVLLSYLSHFQEPFNAFVRGQKKFLLLLGALAVSFPFFLDIQTKPFVMTWGFTILYIGFGAWVSVAALPGAVTGLWEPLEKALASLGKNSYSIYLWHMPVRTLLIPWIRREMGGELSLFPHILLFIALSVAAGYLSAHYIERPFLQFRDRCFPSRAA